MTFSRISPRMINLLIWAAIIICVSGRGPVSAAAYKPLRLEIAKAPVALPAAAMEEDTGESAPPPEEITSEPAPRSTARTTLVTRGDTLVGLLLATGADKADARAAAAALGRRFDPRRLRVGQALTVILNEDSDRQPRLSAVGLSVDGGDFINVRRNPAGAYLALRESTPVASDGDVASHLGVDGITRGGEHEVVRLRRGDTLMKILLRASIDRREAAAAIEALGERYNLRRLQIGQEVVLVLDQEKGASLGLAALGLALGSDDYIVADRRAGGGYASIRARGPLLPATFDSGREAIAATAPASPATLPFDDHKRKHLRIRAGDTLMDALIRAGCERPDAHQAITALRTVYNPRKLRAGQTLTVAFSPEETADTAFTGLSLALEPGRAVEVGRTHGADFAARMVEIPLERELVHAGGNITSNLFTAATNAGLPLPVLMDMIEVFSFDVDFQREIQSGDSFKVLFERFRDERGHGVRNGEVLFAELVVSGNRLAVYRHELASGHSDYFNEKGHSVRKFLMRTPINGARLSSGFGMRKHPIMAYNKMHRGIDFAAPRGTPIKAAGNGVIESIDRNGAYGNYIRLRHTGSYATAYAHLSRFSKGLRAGHRVGQGQIIGYVGSTGRSTGPHLHYEVLRDGRRINPMKVKMPTGKKLAGVELDAFLARRSEVDQWLAALPLIRKVAASACQSDTVVC